MSQQLATRLKNLEAAVMALRAKEERLVQAENAVIRLSAKVSQQEKTIGRLHRRIAALEPMDNLADGAGNGRDHAAQ